MTSSRTRKRKAARQTPTPVVQPQGHSPLTRPDVKLISRQEYWEDFRNRMKIHDYEFNEAVSDMKKCVQFTKELISN